MQYRCQQTQSGPFPTRAGKMMESAWPSEREEATAARASGTGRTSPGEPYGRQHASLCGDPRRVGRLITAPVQGSTPCPATFPPPAPVLAEPSRVSGSHGEARASTTLDTRTQNRSGTLAAGGDQFDGGGASMRYGTAGTTPPAVTFSSARPQRLADPDASAKDWGKPRPAHGSVGDRGNDLKPSAGEIPAALTTYPRGPARGNMAGVCSTIRSPLPSASPNGATYCREDTTRGFEPAVRATSSESLHALTTFRAPCGGGIPRGENRSEDRFSRDSFPWYRAGE